MRGFCFHSYYDDRHVVGCGVMRSMWFYVDCGFILRKEARGYVGRLWFYSYCDDRHVVLCEVCGFMCTVVLFCVTKQMVM